MHSYQGDWALRNPVPEMARDKNDLLRLFNSFTYLVPYAKIGNKTAHATLKMLFDLYELSSVQKLTVQRVTSLCFGHGLEIDASTNAFLQSVGITEKQIVNSVYSGARDESICGTSFLLITVASVGNVYKADITVIPPTHGMPAYDFENEDSELNDTIFYTDKPLGNDFSIKGVKSWKAAKKYPLFSESNGVFTTMLQINATGYENEFWGRGAASAFWQYIDYQSANLTAKISQSEVVSKLLTILKEPDPISVEASGTTLKKIKDDVSESFRSKMTNRGEGEGLGVLWWSGDERPDIKEVAINRDTNYSEHVRSEVITNICAAHGISPILVGLKEQRIGIGANILLDALITANAMTIEPTQKKWEGIMSEIISFIGNITGQTVQNIELLFVNPIQGQIKMINQTRQGNATTDTVNTSGGN